VSKQIQGYIYSILAALFFASGSLFMKRIYAAGMSVWEYSLAHSLITLVILIGMRIAQRRPVQWHFLRQRPFAILGLMVTGLTSAVAFNVALTVLSISLGTILLFTYPAFVTLFAWAFLRQRPGLLHGIALLFSLAGAALTVSAGGDLTTGFSWLGAGLALLSAIAHAVYMLISERLSEVIDSVSTSLLTRIAMITGAVVLAPHAVMTVWSAPWQAWALCGASAIFGGVLPFICLYQGIARIGANQAAIAGVTELPIALLLGILFERESITPLQGAGATLVLGAVLLSQLRSGEGRRQIAD
jgi:drug/metabolite transporter (DMT)-like permease